MPGLDTPLGRVLGGGTANALRKAFGMQVVRDLLTHYPRRLDDRGELTDLSGLVEGEHATVIARTLSVVEHRYPARNGRKAGVRTQVVVTDGNQQLPMTFFGQHWRSAQLKPGTVAMFSGKVSAFRGARQLAQPHVEVLGRGDDVEEYDEEEVQRYWPIYPASAAVSSKKLMDSVKQVLAVLDELPDPLPPALLAARGLRSYDRAIREVHQPADPAEFERARERLRFHEAFVLQSVLAGRRRELREMAAVARPGRPDGLLARFDPTLPFELTAGQRAVGQRIAADLASPHPMHRLLQGDVGSGKTVVAVRAMLQVVDAGGQAALLAPTEVLAAQHLRSVTDLLGPLSQPGTLTGDWAGTSVALLTGSISAAARREALLDVASGRVGIVIGTHAMLEERVTFADLGLVVVDEQHRFGVEQRAAMGAKGGAAPPHVLVMTATPIPRTVAMTVFGDLEVSTLHDLPDGRPGVRTTVVPVADRPRWLGRAWERVREEVEAGHQAYVVCPRIGGTDIEPGQEEAAEDEGYAARRPPRAVLDVLPELAAGPLAGLRIAALHGRLAGDEKDQLMRRFAAGDIDVLVATTVVEVGVDVPNASVMIVLDADRLGVSQLHQLRGRVGRGTAPGVCLLVTEAPAGAASRERLDRVAATSDGFSLAQLDLETRREGDVLGAMQSGRRSSLRLLSVTRDGTVISAAREAADEVVAADPHLDGHPLLAAEVAALAASQQAEFLAKT
ncbi:MAG TPA: ATP-dependent DNA helicase RecG [Nocardioidaceae bacterium]|nr:ATP-dependent DNA helicase RecG [Nocardioidaceae bacterium]